MALIRKPAADATVAELTEFLKVHDLSVPKSPTKAELLETLKLAQLSDTILVAERQQQAVADPNSIASILDSDFDEDDERWMRVRIGEDQNADADGKESPVFVSDGPNFAYLRRGRDIVIRERFVRVLNDAKETRHHQTNGDGTQKFSEATKTVQHRHPFSFLGVVGKVKDGPPEGLPENVQVVR